MKAKKIFTAAAAALLLSTAAYAQDYNAVVDKYEAAAELLQAKNYAGALEALQETVALGHEVGSEAADLVQNAQKLIPQCYLRLGNAAAQGKNWDLAVENLTKASELGELYGEINVVRNANGMIGKVYTAQAAGAFNDKDYAKAAEIFAKGYEADPTNTDLALNLAMSYAEMDDTTNAFRVYREIIDLEDRHSRYKEPVAKARERLGYYTLVYVSKALAANDYDTAIPMMEGVLASDPGHATVNMMYIQTANNQKNYQRVIQYGERAAEAQETPELKSEAYFLLGKAYENTNNNAKAIENFRKVTAGGKVADAKKLITELNK